MKSESEAAGGGRVASALAFSTRWPALGLPQGAAPTRRAFKEALGRAMDRPEFSDALAAGEWTTATPSDSSMEQFRRVLEDGLHRPVLKATKSTGACDFKLQAAIVRPVE